jgi:hypothetical protein
VLELSLVWVKRVLGLLDEVSRRLEEGRKSFSENDVRVSVDLRRRLGVLGSNVLGSNVLGSGVLGSGVLESGVLESGLGALLPKPPFNLKMVKLR